MRVTESLVDGLPSSLTRGVGSREIEVFLYASMPEYLVPDYRLQEAVGAAKTEYVAHGEIVEYLVEEEFHG